MDRLNESTQPVTVDRAQGLDRKRSSATEKEGEPKRRPCTSSSDHPAGPPAPTRRVFILERNSEGGKNAVPVSKWVYRVADNLIERNGEEAQSGPSRNENVAPARSEVRVEETRPSNAAVHCRAEEEASPEPIEEDEEVFDDELMDDEDVYEIYDPEQPIVAQVHQEVVEQDHDDEEDRAVEQPGAVPASFAEGATKTLKRKASDDFETDSDGEERGKEAIWRCQCEREDDTVFNAPIHMEDREAKLAEIRQSGGELWNIGDSLVKFRKRQSPGKCRRRQGPGKHKRRLTALRQRPAPARMGMRMEEAPYRKAALQRQREEEASPELIDVDQAAPAPVVDERMPIPAGQLPRAPAQRLQVPNGGPRESFQQALSTARPSPMALYNEAKAWIATNTTVEPQPAQSQLQEPQVQRPKQPLAGPKIPAPIVMRPIPEPSGLPGRAPAQPPQVSNGVPREPVQPAPGPSPKGLHQEEARKKASGTTVQPPPAQQQQQQQRLLQRPQQTSSGPTIPAPVVKQPIPGPSGQALPNGGPRNPVQPVPGPSQRALRFEFVQPHPAQQQQLQKTLPKQDSAGPPRVAGPLSTVRQAVPPPAAGDPSLYRIVRLPARRAAPPACTQAPTSSPGPVNQHQTVRAAVPTAPVQAPTPRVVRAPPSAPTHGPGRLLPTVQAPPSAVHHQQTVRAVPTAPDQAPHRCQLQIESPQLKKTTQDAAGSPEGSIAHPPTVRAAVPTPTPPVCPPAQQAAVAQPAGRIQSAQARAPGSLDNGPSPAVRAQPTVQVAPAPSSRQAPPHRVVRAAPSAPTQVPSPTPVVLPLPTEKARLPPPDHAPAPAPGQVPAVRASAPAPGQAQPVPAVRAPLSGPVEAPPPRQRPAHSKGRQRGAAAQQAVKTKFSNMADLELPGPSRDAVVAESESDRGKHTTEEIDSLLNLLAEAYQKPIDDNKKAQLMQDEEKPQKKPRSRHAETIKREKAKADKAKAAEEKWMAEEEILKRNDIQPLKRPAQQADAVLEGASTGAEEPVSRQRTTPSSSEVRDPAAPVPSSQEMRAVPSSSPSEARVPHSAPTHGPGRLLPTVQAPPPAVHHDQTVRAVPTAAVQAPHHCQLQIESPQLKKTTQDAAGSPKVAAHPPTVRAAVPTPSPPLRPPAQQAAVAQPAGQSAQARAPASLDNGPSPAVRGPPTIQVAPSPSSRQAPPPTVVRAPPSAPTKAPLPPPEYAPAPAPGQVPAVRAPAPAPDQAPPVPAVRASLSGPVEASPPSQRPVHSKGRQRGAAAQQAVKTSSRVQVAPPVPAADQNANTESPSTSKLQQVSAALDPIHAEPQEDLHPVVDDEVQDAAPLPVEDVEAEPAARALEHPGAASPASPVNELYLDDRDWDDGAAEPLLAAPPAPLNEQDLDDSDWDDRERHPIYRIRHALRIAEPNHPTATAYDLEQKRLEISGTQIGCMYCIGFGRFSAVYRGRNEEGEAVAVRLAPPWQELQIFAELFAPHENRLCLPYMWEQNVDPKWAIFVMPLLETSLQQFIFEQGFFFSPRKIKRLVGELSVALMLLNQKGYVHGSLHPKYVLLDQVGTEMIDGKRCITSFRSCLGGLHKSLPMTAAPSAFKRDQLDQYTAPEIGQQRSLDGRVDAYSVGAIAFVLTAISQNLPLGEGMNLQRIEMLFRQPIGSDLAGLRRIIMGTTKYTVNERWPIQKIYNIYQADKIK